MQGNESKLTTCLLDQGCEIFCIPACDFASEFYAVFILGGAHEVDGEVADDGHVFYTLAFAQA